jgi:hypothetical protein
VRVYPYETEFRVGRVGFPGRGSPEVIPWLAVFPGRGSLRPPAASRCSALRATRSFPRRPPAYVLPRDRGVSKVFPQRVYRGDA